MHKMPVRWEPVSGDCSRGESAGTARLLAKNLRALAAASGSRAKSKASPRRRRFVCHQIGCKQIDNDLSTINFQAARETLEQTLDAEGFSRDSFAPAFTLLDDSTTCCRSKRAAARLAERNCRNHRAGGS